MKKKFEKKTDFFQNQSNHIFFNEKKIWKKNRFF